MLSGNKTQRGSCDACGLGDDEKHVELAGQLLGLHGRRSIGFDGASLPTRWPAPSSPCPWPQGRNPSARRGRRSPPCRCPDPLASETATTRPSAAGHLHGSPPPLCASRAAASGAHDRRSPVGCPAGSGGARGIQVALGGDRSRQLRRRQPARRRRDRSHTGRRHRRRRVVPAPDRQTVVDARDRCRHTMSSACISAWIDPLRERWRSC